MGVIAIIKLPGPWRSGPGRTRFSYKATFSSPRHQQTGIQDALAQPSSCPAEFRSYDPFFMLPAIPKSAIVRTGAEGMICVYLLWTSASPLHV